MSLAACQWDRPQLDTKWEQSETASLMSGLDVRARCMSFPTSCL
jgi:hypothetical protein